MGVEHKIYCSLSDKQKEDVQKLLTSHHLFSETEVVGNDKFFEFRKNKVDNEMPDFSIVIEFDGLYICNNQNYSQWADIDFLKEYLLENHISFKIEEL